MSSTLNLCRCINVFPLSSIRQTSIGQERPYLAEPQLATPPLFATHWLCPLQTIVFPPISNLEFSPVAPFNTFSSLNLSDWETVPDLRPFFTILVCRGKKERSEIGERKSLGRSWCEGSAPTSFCHQQQPNREQSKNAKVKKKTEPQHTFLCSSDKCNNKSAAEWNWEKQFFVHWIDVVAN